MASQTLKSQRLGIYEDLVDESDESPFNYRYELFALGAVVGFVRGERYSEESGYSQEFISVSDISQSSYKETIEFVHTLAALEIINEGYEGEEDELERKAWNRTLEYGDGGIQYINNEVDVQQDMDVIRFVQQAEDSWPDRLDDVLPESTS